MDRRAKKKKAMSELYNDPMGQQGQKKNAAGGLRRFRNFKEGGQGYCLTSAAGLAPALALRPGFSGSS